MGQHLTISGAAGCGISSWFPMSIETINRAETEQVEQALKRLNIDGPAFRRPLRIGDQEQIEILRRINSDRAFCCRCGAASGKRPLGRASEISRVGEHCPCGGLFVPGAALEPHWRRAVEDECC